MMRATDQAALKAIIEGDHGDPFAVLGMHTRGEKSGLVVRAFLPWAEALELRDLRSQKSIAQFQRLHEAGFFEAVLPRLRKPFPYRLLVRRPGYEAEIDDPYRFGPLLQSFDIHLMAEGNHLQLYEVLGAHPRTIDGTEGVIFAVWAPNARRVSVVGPFNDWDGRVHPMRHRPECGVWELFLPGVPSGTLYKFEVKAQGGEILPLKADPFAFYAERPPSTSSIVWGPPRHAWSDDEWLTGRAAANARNAPISIYEVHPGSWRRVPGDGNRSLTYRELAEQLVPYVKDMGFTHLEMLPVMEHPFDGSWGYQPLGLFAPTSRFGSPEDFAALVDCCHQHGIGVLLDWVPGHFPNDPHGIGLFDGTHLYEHADPRKGLHMDWDTLIYNFGRREVANFLTANALFWLDQFHADGLRVDAVASMLYLDYSREPGQWEPNEYGGNENLEALAFLRRVNEQVYGRHPGVVTMAEESTAWPMVTQPTYLGGLGFGYKWNMGWMHDTLLYMAKDPIHRHYHHNELTFSLLYAFNENFVLPLSHDEVVHGKGSLLGKMPGDRWQKFANLRVYFAFMYTHPGKKLLFMGGEFGQEREWDHDRSLDWHLLEDAAHLGIQRLVRDLNRLYRSLPALHERDCEPEGFEWIDATDVDQCVLSFLRRGHAMEDTAIAVCNFTPVVRRNYRLGVPYEGGYREVLNTDDEAYGGSGVGNAGAIDSAPVASHGRPHSVTLTLPPLAAVVLTPARDNGEHASTLSDHGSHVGGRTG